MLYHMAGTRDGQYGPTNGCFATQHLSELQHYKLETNLGFSRHIQVKQMIENTR